MQVKLYIQTSEDSKHVFTLKHYSTYTYSFLSVISHTYLPFHCNIYSHQHLSICPFTHTWLVAVDWVWFSYDTISFVDALATFKIWGIRENEVPYPHTYLVTHSASHPSIHASVSELIYLSTYQYTKENVSYYQVNQLVGKSIYQSVTQPVRKSISQSFIQSGNIYQSMNTWTKT